MRIEETHGRDAFLQLETLWNDVCREQGYDSFFLSHAWYRCCQYGPPEGAEPFVLILRDRSRAVGLVPLLQLRSHWRRFPTRSVSLIENQDSPFVDMLLPPADAQRALAAVLEYLARKPGWHLLALPKLHRASPTHQLVQRGLGGYSHLRIPVARSPMLVLDGDWEHYWKAQSQRFKKTVRNVANRVERLGTMTITDDAEHADAPACMEVFRSVAAKSWKADLPVSVVRSPAIRRFFGELTATLHAQRQLALWVLRIDGVPVATEYHVRDGQTVYALRSDYDQQHADASPGAHLNAFLVRTYFDRGVRCYDMGPGDAEYKQRWATSTKELDTFWLFNRTPYAAALYGMERHAIPHLRRAREWWQGSGEATERGQTDASLFADRLTTNSNS